MENRNIINKKKLNKYINMNISLRRAKKKHFSFRFWKWHERVLPFILYMKCYFDICMPLYCSFVDFMLDLIFHDFNGKEKKKQKTTELACKCVLIHRYLLILLVWTFFSFILSFCFIWLLLCGYYYFIGIIYIPWNKKCLPYQYSLKVKLWAW